MFLLDNQYSSFDKYKAYTLYSSVENHTMPKWKKVNKFTPRRKYYSQHGHGWFSLALKALGSGISYAEKEEKWRIHLKNKKNSSY